MLVIGAHGPIDNSYRFENEPARHKLLDLIGDLALIGRPIQADITATRAGHAMNHARRRQLWRQQASRGYDGRRAHERTVRAAFWLDGGAIQFDTGSMKTCRHRSICFWACAGLFTAPTSAQPSVLLHASLARHRGSNKRVP
jgi:hypothetical protein